MRQVRFGSYSMVATFAGIPNLSRLKSIRRYICLCPPPRKRTMIMPVLLRPPFFLMGTMRDFSGVVLVISEKSSTEMNRREGVYGLNVFIGMVVFRFYEAFGSANLISWPFLMVTMAF